MVVCYSSTNGLAHMYMCRYVPIFVCKYKYSEDEQMCAHISSWWLALFPIPTQHGLSSLSLFIEISHQKKDLGKEGETIC